MQPPIKKCMQTAIIVAYMFKRTSKKQLLIRRTIIYIVMVFAVLVIVAGTILFILGYRIDGAKGNLEQGGLVQYDSTPNGASVKSDGKMINSNTPTKQTVIAGTHSFEISKDGYDTWKKKIDVKAGTLEWLDYARLVPKDLKTESVAQYPQVAGEVASRDNKWLMVQEKSDAATFQLVDLRAKDIKTTTISLPASLYSDAATQNVKHTFAMQEWDDGGRYVIVKHAYNDKSEYLVVDTQDVGTSENISRSLSLSLNQVKFSGTSGNVFYGLSSDGVIRKLDISNGTISRGLVTNAKSFDLYDTDIVTYVGIDPANAGHQVAGIYRDGDDEPHVLRVVNDLTTAVSIDTTRYYSSDYVAIAEGLKVTVLKGRYPSSSDADNSSLKPFADYAVSANVDTLGFSGSGDRLVTQSGTNFTSFEVEYQRKTDAAVSTSETAAHTLRWLDDAYLWAVYDGHLSIREFDGTNVHVIMSMEPGFDATLSQNGKFLYGIVKNGDRYELQRATMVLN
jgi:hypothetical protein